MRLPTSFSAVSIACVIAFAGCDPGSTLQSEQENITAAAESFSEVIPYGNPNRAALGGAASQPGTSLQQRYGSVRAQLVDILEADDPVHEKSARVDDVLRSQSGSPLAPYLEQFAAHRMLKVLLSETHPSAATVGHYTALLVGNENPDAELIHRALQHLAGEWSSDRLSKAAKSTSIRAREWAARVCADCSSRNTKTTRNPALLLKHGQVLDAADKLDDFVGP
ncbi:MAG: hypothetical protein KJO98_15145 [Rhodothermia bacterium]|nr:hypothetical protein [Rhodothermia bacterium]